MRALAWLALLVVVSVAGAGLVLSLDHARTDALRPELTARGHARLAPRLAAMEPDLATLSASGDVLGMSGRDVLSGLRALDPDAVVSALDAGDTALPAVTQAAASLQLARPGLLEGTVSDRLPAADLDRVTAIDAAMAASGELPAAWADITAAAATPVRLLRSMKEHDRLVLAATAAARDLRFSDAVSLVGDAQAQLTVMTTLRDGAGDRGHDVGTLSDLLARLTMYDGALFFLYALLIDSGGVMTDDANKALDAVNLAQQALPTDQAAMVIIVTDLGGADVTPPLLRIERARGAIDGAAGTLD
jgi:hypothetical protein